MADEERAGEPGALVRGAQAGEAGAFDRLYTEHVDHVYGLCLRMTADATRAEALTQDVFVRAWRKLGSFRGESLFGSWLHRLAVNVVLDDARTRKREALRLVPLEDSDESAARPERPELRLDLAAAVAALPDGARQALVLHDVEGYRYEEIAELMGVALGTVKSQIHRARKLLRERLDA